MNQEQQKLTLDAWKMWEKHHDNDAREHRQKVDKMAKELHLLQLQVAKFATHLTTEIDNTSQLINRLCERTDKLYKRTDSLHCCEHAERMKWIVWAVRGSYLFTATCIGWLSWLVLNHISK